MYISPINFTVIAGDIYLFKAHGDYGFFWAGLINLTSASISVTWLFLWWKRQQ